MKNLLKLLVVTALCAFSCVFTGCQEKLKGNEFSLSVKEAGADFITLAVTASKPMEIAYKVTTKAQLVTPAVLFKTGEVIEVADGDVIELREGIQQDTHYYIYAVARFDETTYSERISLEELQPSMSSMSSSLLSRLTLTVTRLTSLYRRRPRTEITLSAQVLCRFRGTTL